MSHLVEILLSRLGGYDCYVYAEDAKGHRDLSYSKQPTYLGCFETTRAAQEYAAGWLLATARARQEW